LGAMTRAMTLAVMETPVGPLAVRGDDEAVAEIAFMRDSVPSDALAAAGDTLPRPVAEALRQLDEYFRGQRRRFDLPLRLEGTPFQRAVWAFLLTIPYGRTYTYKEVAEALGKPGAARAVGAAVSSNPVSIVVPCHRVVAAGGKLGGYGGGLDVKRYLLQLEGIRL